MDREEIVASVRDTFDHYDENSSGRMEPESVMRL
jgi:hypothetical protein